MSAPSRSLEDAGIPILDLERFRSDASSFVQELGEGFQRFGFVGIRGHGVEDSWIDTTQEAMRRLFALPDTVKMSYEIPQGAGQRGYTSLGREKAKDGRHPDLKEFWHVGRELSADDPLGKAYPHNVWPREVPGFQESTLRLYHALEELGITLLRAVAEYLELDPGFFTPKVDRGNSILRLIHYPPIVSPTKAVRASQHEDINLLTLLIGSEESGLEILSRPGRWIPVTTLENTIVCNVGDMLQRLTNDVLHSTTHRVVNPPIPLCQRSRYSAPFFLHFNADVRIETLPQCISAVRPNRYPTPITAHEYLCERLREIGLLKDE